MFLMGLIWAFLRRWYGGLFDENKHKIIGNRGLQTAVMILSMIPMFLFGNYNVYMLLFSLGMSMWIQFQFWSRAVGCILDCGRNENPDITKYNRWYRYFLNLFFKPKYRYNKLYDFIYTEMRYGCPMIVPGYLISWWYVLIGLLSAPVYFGCYRLFENKPKLSKLPDFINQPKNMSEIIYGFIFGFGIYAIWLSMM